MPAPSGFAYSQDRTGGVVITHNGRRAAVLRGKRAVRFLRALDEGEPQMLMAKATGNYKRGNERRLS